MKSSILILVSVVSLALWVPNLWAEVQVESDNGSLKTATLQSLTNMPMAFTQNRGQWPDSILYRANAGGATMWFTPDGAFYQFFRRIPKASKVSSVPDAMAEQMRMPGRDLERDSVETMMIKASLIGCNLKPEIAGESLLEYKCNYFLGNDHSKWRTDVPNYNSVTYKEIYIGIDLKYYGDSRQMEYDFIVAPRADYSQVKIGYEGAKSLDVNANGDLVIETAWGKVTEKAPVVYQMDGSTRRKIAGAYRIADSLSFGFTLGPEYNSTLPVVIDPVLVYSTYLGGNGSDEGSGIAVDSAGNAYVTGKTESAQFPVVNPFDSSLGGVWGNADAFVAKINPAGNSLLYSTYLGGRGGDFPYGIAVDLVGCAYITGQISSPDFPTVNAFDDSSEARFYDDAFVAKLGPNGNILVYSSYLGGSGDFVEFGDGIAVDLMGSAYVVGMTCSPSFPIVASLDSSLTGTQDGFVTKVSPAGNALVYSSYLGGNGGDEVFGVVVDLAGSAYLVGYTESSDFPTVRPFDSTYHGNSDAFVAKLSPDCKSFVYSSYLGGSGDDMGFCIAVDSTGSSYVSGYLRSPDFPTFTPFDSSYNGGRDVFVTKLNPTGDSLLYSSFLGGSGHEWSLGIGVDRFGSVYVTGGTQSSDFQTFNALYGSLNGVNDAFVTKVSPAGSSLIYSTYLGGNEGNSRETTNAIAVDRVGNAYVTGGTPAADFPTVSPFDSSFAGGYGDAFVAKISPQGCCVGIRGNVDGDPGDLVDIGDVMALVTYLTGYDYPPVFCPDEWDANGSTVVDIADISFLVSYLVFGGPSRLCP